MKITMLQGLPGSGKSTIAKTIVEVSKNTVRVNKDLIREMVYFLRKTWNREDTKFRNDVEPAIIMAEFELVKFFLDRGFNVVVDDTNFSKKHLNRYEQLAKQRNCEFELVALTTDVEVCIKRDKARTRGSVGEKVIRTMAERHNIKV